MCFAFVFLKKYIDIFGGTLGFWLFGYALSGNANANDMVLGEDRDYIFWFFRVSLTSFQYIYIYL